MSVIPAVGIADNVQIGIRRENLTGAISVNEVVAVDHRTYDPGVHADQATRGVGQPAAEITHSSVSRTHAQ